MSVCESNASIRNKIVGMYKSFVTEVDPRNVLDLLIQRRIMTIERKDEVMSRKTRQDRCRALLDQLFYCSHNEAFVVLREALDEHYHWIVERIDSWKIAQNEDSVDSNPSESDIKSKLAMANNRIKELECEVSRCRQQNAELLKQLQGSSSSYVAFESGSTQKKITDSVQNKLDSDIYEPVSETCIKVSDNKNSRNKTANVYSDSPCPPSLPPRPTKETQGAGVKTGSNCLSLLTTINGSAAVRGMAMLDNVLYVAWFGSMSIELFDGKHDFKKNKKFILITCSQSTEKLKVGNRKKPPNVHPKTIRASSGIQDIACCKKTKRLYISDWQTRSVHCVDTLKRDVVHRWYIDAGEPWGISLTPDGSVLVSCGSSGELLEYSSEGTLIRSIGLKMVEDGPWHGLQFGPSSVVFCYGERYGDGGYVNVSDLDGNYLDGYNEVPLHGPAHLALLPDNRVLVAESGRNRVVILEQSLRGLVEEILNPDHGITMPVRLHYCQSSDRLCVGLQNGSIQIYQFKNNLTGPSNSTSC